MNKYRYFRLNFSSIMRTKITISKFMVGIVCLLIVSSLSSKYIYINILNNRAVIDRTPKTSTAPTFSIDSPSNYSLYGKLAPNYSLTITEGIGNFTWYEFLELGLNSTPIELEGAPNEYIEAPFNQTMWNSLSNGTTIVRFYVNNSLGEIGYLDAIIRIDILDPVINIISPTGGFFNSTPPDYTIEISDYNLNKTWYTLNTNQTNFFFISNGTIDGWSYLNDGLVNITFYANDSVSNENSDSVQVIKDTVDPGVPSSLTSNPLSWVNIDNFNLSWSNPADTSGITGAYYKLDSVPSTDADGTYVAGADIESITGITVTSEGAHTIYVWLVDNTGNIDHTNYASTQLYLDATDPSSPSELVANPVSWTNVDYFNLSWSNPVDTSGIIGAYYKLDSIPISDTDGTYVAGVDVELITGIFVTTDGAHTVYVWLVDEAGNVDYTSYTTTQLYLDTTNPSSPSGLGANPVSWTNVDYFNLSWYNPADTSGITGAYYKLDSIPISDADGTYVAGVDVESITGISVTTDGAHTVYIWLNDSAGNIDYTNYASTQLYLDTTDPSSPSELVANPVSWTNVDYFNLTWSNPADTSGITGAYYKLDSVPISDADGTYVAGVDVESIMGISVTTDGAHTVYLWLNDSAGNINYLNYDTTQLYLDTTDPSSPSGLIAIPVSWTNVDYFNLSWSNPVDISGISGAYYKFNSVPTSNSDGVYVAGTDLESLIDISIGIDGIHTIYVWLNDSAGNIDYLNYDTTQLYLDTIDPSSPSGLIAIPVSWTNVDLFNLTWSNPVDTSGIIGAYYKLDSIPISDADGAYVAGVDVESITGISVTTDGAHIVYVWLVDDAGNVDYTNYTTTQLYLDTTDPYSPSGLIAIPVSWTNIDYFNLTWSNPADTSGITGAYYKLDSVPISDADGTYVAGVDVESITGISVTTEGTHTVYVWLVDNAGNVDNTNYASTQLYLDTTDPSSPSGLGAIPVSWTNIDYFNLTWSNPVDTSGIIGAYYNLDSVPISDTDGTYVAGVDIESITGIIVITDGTHTVYVWLVDDAGNVDYTNYTTTQLYLDTADPSSPSGLGANPVSWTNIDYFNLTWSNPVDTSGIIGAYYNLDSVPISDTDGTYVGGVDIELITGITVTTDGAHTVYVWLVDDADNVDYTSYTTTQLYLDTTDPSSPTGLLANPVSWTNIDSFNLSWSNPSDTSGISGAYYKFDSVPTSNSDGVYVAGTDLESLIDISIGIDGIHTIYVWLNDSAGNIDYLNYDTTQLYLDTSNPLVIDSQVGDDVWRNTAGITYDVDFSDPLPSSNLDYAQYKITSETGQGGTILKDWVAIFINLGATSYTNDWSIDFAACKEGINYISVRVYDEVGNIQVANDIFYVKKDTINPILVLNTPVNNTYWNTPPPINITVYEPNFASLTYTVIGYSPVGLVNNTDVLLSQVIWDSLPQGEFLIVITCFDILSQSSELTITLYKDTIAPSITINSPANNTFWNSTPFLNITAIDPNIDAIWYSVNNVNITLQNNTLQQLNISIWNNLPEEGKFEVQIYANDSFGFLNDNYVLTLYKDVVAPTLIINSPLNNTFHKLPPVINVTVMDPYFHSLWYRVGTQNIALINNTNLQLPSIIWDNLPEEGGFTIYFYANDSVGNLNDLFRLDINKDIRNPVVVITNPNPNDLFGDFSPDFDISISELNLNQTWYMLYNQTWNSLNYSFNELTGRINQAVWDEFGNGTVTIRFYANDTLNNLGFSEVTVRKNIFAPIITIVSPENNNLFGIVAPNITLYKAGLELNTTWYTIDYGVTNYTFFGLNVVINQSAWDNYGFGDVILTFYINDSLGKIGFDEITLRKDPDPPEVTITFIDPLNNNSYCAEEPTFRITAYDPNLYSIWYRVGLSNITIINNTVIVLNDTIWNSLSQGPFTIEVFAVDVLGYLNDSITLTFYKDTIAPNLVINQPYDGNSYNTPPPINITVYDPNFWFMTYTVIGYSSVVLENNTEVLLSQAIWDSLSQGEFLVSITAYDTFSHSDDSYILTLYKDTIGPIFEMILPLNNSYHKSPPIIKAVATDPNLHTIWYKVGATSIELINNTEQALDLSIWNGIDEGVFNVEIYANDSFGYISSLVNLTLFKDITIPLITINSPLNNTHYSAPPTMNIVAFDINLDAVWYSVTGINILLSSGTEPFDASIWNSLAQGKFDVFIFANDTAGNLNNSLMLTLYKDTLAPFLTVNSPFNTTYWNSRPVLNITAYDPNLQSISYRVFPFLPLPLVNNTDAIFNGFIWNSLTEGIFIIEIIAEDRLGNINNSIKLTLYKDTAIPVITINLPQPNDVFGEISPSFEISVIENNLNNTWYTLIGESSNFIFSGFTGTINQIAWDTFGNGTVVIKFYANDTASNLAYKEVIVRKNLFTPIITINSPGDNDLFGITSPDFVIYKSGSVIQSTWYTIDNDITNFTFTGLSGTIDQFAWNVFGYETITLTFYINDSLGKIGTDEVIVRKDPNMPIILVNSPINLTAFASTPFINLTIIDPNLHKVWYRINSITIDITDNLTQFLDFLLWDNFTQGQFRIELFANDTIGNLNDIWHLNLSKDIIGPIITIIQPTVNMRVGRNAPYFELSISDENGIDSSWYTIDGNINITKFTGSIGRIDQNLWANLWDDLPQGSIVTIRFYSNDTLGNVNYTEIYLIIDKPVDLPKLILYPLGFLFTTLGIVAMVPLTLKFTKTRYYKSLNNKDKKKLRNVLITAVFFLSLMTLFFII